MTNRIIDKQTAEHYFGGDNCGSWILVNTDGLSVKQESMPGGTRPTTDNDRITIE
ncbi:hypothetical protein OCK74_20045 [Chitinophagaceae bacterium LB-8]|uniref:Uncharacterized protein n=1 Tax=Paraflavisolibacter caeni TaxID=2982496 RepID=A0A9X2XYY3_9BACT|nr:hypothetical protein [Paraflavisolibacter caeni]MCU7551425.1 hypothetical protein [Paraflavisolibacter caeni]